MADKLIDLSIDEVSLVDSPANKRKFLVMKRADDLMDKLKAVMESALEKVFKPSLEEKENEDMADSGDGIEIELEIENEEEEDDEMSEEMTKRLEILEKSAKEAEILKAENAKIKEQLAAVEAVAKAEKEARVNREYAEKAAVFKSLAIDTDELANILKAVNAIDADLCTKVEGVLKAANEAVEKSDLFKSYGTNGGQESSVMGEIEAKTAEIMKSDSKLTKEQAFAKALHENPSLYERYESEVNQ